MANNLDSLNIDSVELFFDCLSQATLIVKQVLPTHYTNATPDAEWDVRDLTGHMLALVEAVPAVLDGGNDLVNEQYEEHDINNTGLDLSVQWQAAVDRVEAAVSEIDSEETVLYHGEQTAVENLLIEIAGDLLIHAWDLGEAIGMPVRFQPTVAEAVMETTIVPNKVMLSSHTLFAEPIDPPANADLQARLLALFGRSHAWRTAT